MGTSKSLDKGGGTTTAGNASAVTAAALSQAAVLENGDHLTREEFERRYRAMPALKKAELVEGVVYMASPLRYRRHARPHSQIMTWLGYYAASLPAVEVADNASLRLDANNEVQPDALMRLDERAGGRSRLTEDDYLAGPPELIVEIASSSAAYDRHEKLHVYRRNGVAEYLLWLVEDHKLEWYGLKDGRYVALKPDPTGTLKSRAFPGLWLDSAALLQLKMRDVLDTLESGLNSTDAAAFAERLKHNVKKRSDHEN